MVCHIKHWHSVAVGALSYSATGSMLLSGGHECVLVQWQEDSQDFFPRLNSEITGICVSNDGMLYATTHKDNCKSGVVISWQPTIFEKAKCSLVKVLRQLQVVKFCTTNKLLCQINAVVLFLLV